MRLGMKKFSKNLFTHIRKSFGWSNLTWHIVAVVLTAIIVLSGTDWHYFLATQNEALSRVLYPAVFIGFFVPLVVPLGFIISGRILNKKIMELVGWTLGHAALAGSLISSFYKAFTGRVQPDLGNLLVDSSRNFEFGFLRHGVFWGWPSSHTAIAFAMAVSLMYLFPKNKTLQYAGLIYAFYIGIGVSTSIHWFSEFVAGAIIGVVIGKVVGDHFRLELPKSSL